MFLLGILLTSLMSCEGAKILGLFAHYGISHWNVHEPLLKELAERGHSLVVVSPFDARVSLNCSNCTRFVNTRRVVPHRDAGFVGVDSLGEDPRGAWGRMWKMLNMAENVENVLSLKEVQDLILEEFDVVLIEMFNTEIFYAIAHKIGRPTVGIMCHSILSWHSEALRDPYDLSYIPNVNSNVQHPMRFFDRLMNTIQTTLSLVMYRTLGGPRFQTVAETHLGPLPSLWNLMAETNLVLVNSHFSITGAQPHLPNVIEVGGINIGPKRPLPHNLQEIMDKASGVIYFSLGSAAKGSMSEAKRHVFLRVFQGLDKVILWKYDRKMKDAPANVITGNWFPQRDILAHEKVELFISHCGALSMNEAVAESIPILCIPLFGDQFYNSQLLKSKGVALILDYRNDIQFSKLKRLINELFDKSFKDAAQRIAAAYNDRPMSPLNASVYWIEYVVRHQGVEHLKSPARSMSWITYRNLDVWAILSLFVLVICLMIVALFKRLWNCARLVRNQKLN